MFAPSEPVNLADGRKILTAEARLKLASVLTNAAGHIAAGDMKAGAPYAVVVVILTDDVPVLLASGLTSWEDMRDTDRAFTTYHTASLFKARGEDVDPQDRIAERHRAARRMEAEEKLLKEQYNRDHPWHCEYCAKRYKTERGAVQHERKCWKNPTAQQFISGEFIPLQVRDGKAHGWSRVAGWQGEER